MNKKGIKLNKDDTLKYVKYSSQVMSNPSTVYSKSK